MPEEKIKAYLQNTPDSNTLNFIIMFENTRKEKFVSTQRQLAVARSPVL